MDLRVAVLLLLFGFLVRVDAQIIDITEFESPIGTVHHFRGTFQGYQGELVATALDGSSFQAGARRTDMVFTANDPLGNFTMSTYSVSGANVQRSVSNSNGNFTIRYNPAWRPFPRFVEIGQSYNSSTTFSYTANGNAVNGTISMSGRVVGIETVQVNGLAIQTVRVDADGLQSESFSGGWSQTELSESYWFARGIGMVRYRADLDYVDSYGSSQNVVTDYLLSYSNRSLTPQPVFPQTDLYSGWAYLQFPWVYYIESSRWVYLMDEPWIHDFGQGGAVRFVNTADRFAGWLYFDYPWAYSTTVSDWIYVYGNIRIYDAASGQTRNMQ